jgi:hypothetical protein
MQNDSTSAEMTAHSWVGLSDKGLIAPMMSHFQTLRRGYFVAEFTMPKGGGEILLNHQVQDDLPRSFALFLDRDAGIAVLQRRGAQVVRHMLKGPLPSWEGAARVTLKFDIDRDYWAIVFDIPQGPALRAEGKSPLAVDFEDVAAICAPLPRHKDLLWFGFYQGAEMPKSGPWISQRTELSTPGGQMAAGHLDRGDILMTVDHGPLPLRSVQRFEVPARGSFAPVLLRAPFFASGQDLLVSADQHLLISGGEVEYLLGTDAVLVSAQAMIDGRTAIADDRRAVTSALRLDFGQPALLDLGGLVLAVGHDDAVATDYLCPNRFEVATLLAMQRRQVSR